MQNILVVGAGRDGLIILDLLHNLDYMNVKAIIDADENAPGIIRAKSLGITYGHNLSDHLSTDLHIIIDVSGDPAVFTELLKSKGSQTMLIPNSVAKLLIHLLQENDTYIMRIRREMRKQRMIFDSIEEGMIGINEKGKVDFFNKRAGQMVNISMEEVIGKSVTEVIPMTRLPYVLKTGNSELNQKLTLANGLKIVTSRYALLDYKGNIMGAFAVFKDITEVLALAEEITDLKRVQTMLEAIIHSSDDAISVVDEEGNGVLVNPAYIRLTGLTEKEVIGKPATLAVSEEESIHLKVLETRKPIRGIHTYVGENNNEVIVNVAPIIVNQQIKGSVGVIHDMTKMRALMNELDHARSIIRKLESTYTFDDIYGSSKEIKIPIEQAMLAARNDVPILLRGEVGSGKELFAHAIHSGSDRKDNKFVRVNSATIDLKTVEAALFNSKKNSLFKETENGTLFLDEIADLTLATQKMLYHYISEGTRLSNDRDPPVDPSVRIITATAKNLEKAMLEGEFLEELYYMLNRISIQIPPLRTRKEDIAKISNQLLMKLNEESGMNVEIITNEALEKLKQYDWPGNVRELENVLSRAMIYMDPSRAAIELEDVVKSLSTPREIEDDSILDRKSTLTSIMNEYEETVLKAALRESNGNKSLAANRLDISLRSLYYKLEKFNLV